MAIFEPLASPNHWRPSPLAGGPFAGLQGGAVASLLTAEIEALAEQRKWGRAICSTAWFLRPTPMADMRTQLAVVTEGGRVSVIDNTLWPVNEDQPCATVRVTLSRERAIEVPGLDRTDRRSRRSHPVPSAHGASGPGPSMVHGRHGGARRRWRGVVSAQPPDHRRRRAACRRAWTCGLDPWHCASAAERGGRSQSEPDGSVVPAAPRGRGSVSVPRPAGRPRPGSVSAAAPCSTSTAKSAAFRCR